MTYLVDQYSEDAQADVKTIPEAVLFRLVLRLFNLELSSQRPETSIAVRFKEYEPDKNLILLSFESKEDLLLFKSEVSSDMKAYFKDILGVEVMFKPTIEPRFVPERYGEPVIREVLGATPQRGARK